MLFSICALIQAQAQGQGHQLLSDSLSYGTMWDQLDSQKK